MRSFRVRISSVRMKNGGASVHVLQPNHERDELHVREQMKELIETHLEYGDIAGFAAVVWSSEMYSTCHHFTGERSRIPLPLIPDFVRGRLHGYIGAKWAREDRENEQ